jgi:hypothetical protein
MADSSAINKEDRRMKVETRKWLGIVCLIASLAVMAQTARAG